MANTTTPLTNTEVKHAKPKEKEYSLMDGGGLKLRISPKGSKLWVFNYSRPFTKKRANLSLGPYPELSLADARRKREDARSLLAKDLDPKEHRDSLLQKQKEAHINTFENVAVRWFEIKRTEVAKNTANDIWRSLELHVFPGLGKYPIHKILAPQVIDSMKPIAAKGSAETVKRLCQRINELMTWAVNTGLVETNRLAGIGKAFKAPAKKHMPTLKPEELPELMQTLSVASIKITTRCLIEWQLHTMVRPSEAAGVEWIEIDFDNALWNIPGERMKKKRPHIVPMSPQVLALLEVMRPISGHREHIFVSDRNPRTHTNTQTANMALKRMGFAGRLVAHGMRSLASTTLNEQGFDSDVIEAALAHSDKNEVRAAYNRSDYLERRRVMMNWWSEHIDKAATGNMSLTNSFKMLNIVKV